MMWCGSDNESVLINTINGQIYRSRDKGASFKHLTTMMNKQAQTVADENQKIGRVQSMQQNPMDDSLIVFIGK